MAIITALVTIPFTTTGTHASGYFRAYVRKSKGTRRKEKARIFLVIIHYGQEGIRTEEK
jgi:hypothetical protein